MAERARQLALRALQRTRPARPAPPDPGSSGESLRMSEPDEREAYLVLDLALRAGEVLLSGGAGAADVTAATMAVANACGLQRVECDITFTSITMVYVRAADVAPVTSLRLVRRRALDYTRVTEVHNLVQDLVDGRIDRAAAAQRLEQGRTARAPYRSSVVTTARASLAAAIAVQLGAGLVDATAAFLSTVAVDRLNLLADRRQVPGFYQNVLGGLVATAVTLGLVAADAGVRPSLVVAGGIILLLPGSTLVGAVQDAITGYLVTASARALEVLLLTAGIVAGIALSLEVGLRLGLSVQIARAPDFTLSQVPVQVLAAGVAAAAFAVANASPRRTLPGALLAGALGYGVLLLGQQAGLSAALSSAAGAAVVGFGSFLVASRQKAPPLVVLAAGIIPLLPGLAIYRGMLQLADGNALVGLTTLLSAVTTGLALASGAILGEFLAQPARREVRRFEQRLAGPRLAGPLL